MRRLLQPSDAELVRRALAGSQDAYRALVTRFERPVLTVILRLVRDPALAQDLAQETFLKAFRHLQRFDPSRKLASWLFTIAHNTCLDHLRRRRLIEVPVESSGESSPESEAMVIKAPDNEAPDLQAVRGELQQAVETALAELRPAYREVLMLRFEQGLAYEEICEVMDLPMGTVKIHLHRARKALAERLNRKGFTLDASRGRRRRIPAAGVASETPRPAPA